MSMDTGYDSGLPNPAGASKDLRFVPSELSIYRHSQEWWEMSERITDGLLNGSISVDDGAQTIKESKSVRESYPLLEVPQDFIIKRPSIIFVPLSISIYKPSVIHTANGVEPYNPFGELLERLNNSDVKNLQVKNLEELKKAWSTVLPLVNIPDINREHAQVLSQLTFNTYLANLELHRLAADSSGTAIRFTRNERELLDSSQLEEFGHGLRSLPDTIQDIARNKHLTFWYRKDGRDMQPWYPNRKPSVKTIGELEKNHLLALDTAEDSAIVAISKS